MTAERKRHVPGQSNSPDNSPIELTEPASLLLDVVRFLAAIAVVVDHLSLSEFRTGLPSLEVLGYIAVPVFFVLSGFVNRYVTLTREVTVREYMIDRASRMYSVVIPAMVLTLALSAICLAAVPVRFRLEIAPLFTHPIARLVHESDLPQSSLGTQHDPIHQHFRSGRWDTVALVTFLCGLGFFLRGWPRLATLAVGALDHSARRFCFCSLSGFWGCCFLRCIAGGGAREHNGASSASPSRGYSHAPSARGAAHPCCTTCFGRVSGSRNSPIPFPRCICRLRGQIWWP